MNDDGAAILFPILLLSDRIILVQITDIFVQGLHTAGAKNKKVRFRGLVYSKMVEIRGLEPLTF